MMVSKTVFLLVPLVVGFYLNDWFSGFLYGLAILLLLKWDMGLEFMGWEYWQH